MKKLIFILLLFLFPSSTTNIVVREDRDKKDIVVTFFLKKKENVVFSHRTHAAVKNIPCSLCHESLLKEYMEKAKGTGMKYYEFLDKKFCLNCHSGKVSFNANLEKNCILCHKKER